MSRTITRPDHVRQLLERDVLPQQLGATYRVAGSKPAKCTVERGPGGLLRVRGPGAGHSRRGVLVAVEITTKTRMYRFHADAYGSEGDALLIDRPQLVEEHPHHRRDDEQREDQQRRNATRRRDSDLQMRVPHLGEIHQVLIADLSMAGVGFLAAHTDLPVERGTRLRARLERRLGEGEAVAVEIVQVREAPGTGLEFFGCRFIGMKASTRRWLAEQLGEDFGQVVA